MEQRSKSHGARAGLLNVTLPWMIALAMPLPLRRGALGCEVMSADNNLAPIYYATPSPDGAQDRDSRCATRQECYINLVIRLTEGGAAEIVRARFIEGRLIQRDTPAGDYFYEVACGEEPRALAFLPEDPLTIRGFAASAGEKVERAKSATIVINIPLFGTPAGCDLGLRFYRIELGEKIEKLDVDVLRRLKSQRRLRLQYEISSEKLRRALSMN